MTYRMYSMHIKCGMGNASAVDARTQMAIQSRLFQKGILCSIIPLSLSSAEQKSRPAIDRV